MCDVDDSIFLAACWLVERDAVAELDKRRLGFVRLCISVSRVLC